MSEISQELDLIGLSNERPVTLKEAKRCFRRKSHLLLPEKSLGAPNAHARFEELNNAFVRVLKYLRDNNGDSIEEIIPGEVDVKKAMFVIKVKKGSVPFWRRVIRSVYPTVIIGAQKKINFIPGAQGRAVRFVVYWKGGLEGSLQQLKVNLVLYENELLQVSGSGFFLWTMDNYQDLARQVEETMLDYLRSEDEGVVTEEFSSSRGSSETQAPLAERGQCPRPACSEPQCEAANKLDNIMKYLEDLDEEMTAKCSHLNSCIENLQTDFGRQLAELTVSLERQEEKYREDHRLTQEKIGLISEKVHETSQIISGAATSSKISKVTEKAVAVDKARQKLSGSPAKSNERVGRKTSRTRQGGVESPDRKESRSTSPRKKDSELRRRKERRSRSRSKSPQKSLSSLETTRRSSGGSSARVVDIHQTTKPQAGINQDEEEEFDDETGGSSVSLDV